MKHMRGNRLHYPVRHFESLKDWKKYAGWLRTHARVSLALEPAPPKTPLKAKVFDRFKGEGYTCEKVYFESLPGFYVTGNLFRPTDRPKRKMPAILCPHGHFPYGRLHDDRHSGSVIARCITFARMGAAVFSYDMVGYNDSCQFEHQVFEEDHAWGLSLMGLQTWNSIRALDFMLNLPGAGIDPKRIGVTGCSGGGTQTFTLCAVDDRPTVSAPICMVSYHMQGGCQCENAPLLRTDATSVELARLFAPKPQLLGSCIGDWTKLTAVEEFPALQAIYKLQGRENAAGHHQVYDLHNYNRELREAVYRFFNKHLFDGKCDDLTVEAEGFATPSMPERLVWWGKPAPDALPFDEFRQTWRQWREAALKPYRRSPQKLAPLLKHVLAFPSDGLTASEPETVRIASDGNRLTVTPRKAPAPPKDILFYNAYNPTTFSQRVQEIVWAVQQRGGRVELTGNGEAGLPCLFAAAVCKAIKSVDADAQKFNPNRDEDWAKHIDVPAIRQIGGMVTVFAGIGKRSVTLRNASDALRKFIR